MNEHTEIQRLLIAGHTDNVGSAKHNKLLSRARADSFVVCVELHILERQAAPAP